MLCAMMLFPSMAAAICETREGKWSSNWLLKFQPSNVSMVRWLFMVNQRTIST